MPEQTIVNNSKVIEFYYDSTLVFSIDNSVDNGDSYIDRDATTGNLRIYAKGDLAITIGDS